MTWRQLKLFVSYDPGAAMLDEDRELVVWSVGLRTRRPARAMRFAVWVAAGKPLGPSSSVLAAVRLLQHPSTNPEASAALRELFAGSTAADACAAGRFEIAMAVGGGAHRGAGAGVALLNWNDGAAAGGERTAPDDHHRFVNALRECLGVGPLYGIGNAPTVPERWAADLHASGVAMRQLAAAGARQ